MVDKSTNDFGGVGYFYKIVSFSISPQFIVYGRLTKTGSLPGNAYTGNHWSVHDMSTVICYIIDN